MGQVFTAIYQEIANRKRGALSKKRNKPRDKRKVNLVEIQPQHPRGQSTGDARQGKNEKKKRGDTYKRKSTGAEGNPKA